MNKSLKIKAAVIVGVILICIYGLIGIPKSKDELVKNLKNSIHLGLDLRGGSNLVLQVQVQDAFNAEAAQVVDRLKEELPKASINFASIDNSEAKTLETADQVAVNIKGIPSDRTSQFRSLIAEKYPNWILTPANASDYRMTL